MLRALFCALVLAGTLAGCHKDTDPPPMHPKEGDLPPLPPSSGTAVGYLIDNATQLQLRDEQVSKLKEIDTSLAARNDEIETQIRIIEKPDEEPAEKGQPPPRHNNAPGAQVKTTPEAGKLKAARDANDHEALQKAFAVLDPDQQVNARKLLEDRGIAAPGTRKQAPAERGSDDGVPMEP